MEPDHAPVRMPYSGIHSTRREGLRNALKQASHGTYTFTASQISDSDLEILYAQGILSKRRLQGPGDRAYYELTEEARRDLGIDGDKNQRDNANWERAKQPEILPRFIYKIRKPLTVMVSETDRRDFLRNSTGHFEKREFTTSTFRGFLANSGYVSDTAPILLQNLYDLGILERKRMGSKGLSWYAYRFPDDIKDLVALPNTPAEHII